MNQDFLEEKGLHFQSQERGKTCFQTKLVFENEIEVRAFWGQKQMLKAKTLIHGFFTGVWVGQNDIANTVVFGKINLSPSFVFTGLIEPGVSYYVATKKSVDPPQLRITRIFEKWWLSARFELLREKETDCLKKVQSLEFHHFTNIRDVTCKLKQRH